MPQQPSRRRCLRASSARAGRDQRSLVRRTQRRRAQRDGPQRCRAATRRRSTSPGRAFGSSSASSRYHTGFCRRRTPSSRSPCRSVSPSRFGTSCTRPAAATRVPRSSAASAGRDSRPAGTGFRIVPVRSAEPAGRTEPSRPAAARTRAGCTARTRAGCGPPAAGTLVGSSAAPSGQHNPVCASSAGQHAGASSAARCVDQRFRARFGCSGLRSEHRRRWLRLAAQRRAAGGPPSLPDQLGEDGIVLPAAARPRVGPSAAGEHPDLHHDDVGLARRPDEPSGGPQEAGVALRGGRGLGSRTACYRGPRGGAHHRGSSAARSRRASGAGCRSGTGNG